MLKKRIEQLEQKSKNKTKEYKNFNAFYEDVKKSDCSFNRFYAEEDIQRTLKD